MIQALLKEAAYYQISELVEILSFIKIAITDTSEPDIIAVLRSKESNNNQYSNGRKKQSNMNLLLVGVIQHGELPDSFDEARNMCQRNGINYYGGGGKYVWIIDLGDTLLSLTDDVFFRLETPQDNLVTHVWDKNGKRTSIPLTKAADGSFELSPDHGYNEWVSKIAVVATGGSNRNIHNNHNNNSNLKLFGTIKYPRTNKKKDKSTKSLSADSQYEYSDY